MNSTKVSLGLLVAKYEEEKKHLEDPSITGFKDREIGYRNGMNKGSANTLGCVIRDLKNIMEGMKDE